MNKHIININGKTFVFYLKGRRLDVFMYKNGPQKVDFTTFKNKNEAKKFFVKGILEMFKKEILDNIKNKKYTSIEQLKKDLDSKIDLIDNDEIKKLKIKSNIEYENILKELSTVLQKQLDNVDEKKQIIEKNMDIDLKELFERNGITEYEIKPSKNSTLIVYKGKDGTPHTIINNNPNISIYDIIVKNLQFDYNTKENEIDNSIQEIIDREAKFTFTKNETIDEANIENYMDEIVKYIKNTRTDINKIYGIKPANNKIDGALILESNKGFEPIIVTRKENGQLNVDFPNKKEVDKTVPIAKTKENAEKDIVEEELNKVSNEANINEITEKINQNDSLTIEEEKCLTTFLKDIYNKMNSDLKLSENENNLIKNINETDLYDKIIYQIPNLKEILDEIIKTYNPIENVKKDDKIKKIKPPKDKNAFIELTIVTFISGLISGLFVYTFFKMLF